MERVWAPWRKAYILGKKGRGCLFCRHLRAGKNRDQKNLLLYRSSSSYIMLNRYPYTNAHLMLIPNRHLASLEELNAKERLDLFGLLDLSLKLLKKSFRPQGFNIGINLGKAGGAGIPGHVHVHVVPRWLGDTNFMPVTSGVKVISDSLDSTYRHLQRVLKSSERSSLPRGS